jgi:hypothetical protein
MLLPSDARDALKRASSAVWGLGRSVATATKSIEREVRDTARDHPELRGHVTDLVEEAREEVKKKAIDIGSAVKVQARTWTVKDKLREGMAADLANKEEAPHANKAKRALIDTLNANVGDGVGDDAALKLESLAAKAKEHAQEADRVLSMGKEEASKLLDEHAPELKGALQAAGGLAEGVGEVVQAGVKVGRGKVSDAINRAVGVGAIHMAEDVSKKVSATASNAKIYARDAVSSPFAVHMAWCKFFAKHPALLGLWAQWWRISAHERTMLLQTMTKTLGTVGTTTTAATAASTSADTHKQHQQPAPESLVAKQWQMAASVLTDCCFTVS